MAKWGGYNDDGFKFLPVKMAPPRDLNGHKVEIAFYDLPIVADPAVIVLCKMGA
jgi:hypothetical protein